MRVDVRTLGIGVIIILIAAILIYLLYVNQSSINGGNHGQMDVDLSINVQVMDLINHTPVTGATVYLVTCSPNDTSYRDVHETGTTGADGLALFSTNYMLSNDQAIYLGASDIKPLVEADFASHNFNGSGYIGAWKSFNYSLLYNGQDTKATLACTITVDEDSGKMI